MRLDVIGKKLSVCLVAGLAILLVVGGVWWGKSLRLADHPTSPHPEQTVPLVTVTVDRGETVATYSGIPAKTPYIAFETVVKREGLSLETKQYDFGIFVKKVGSLESGSDKAWIVSVNGTSLTVAADRMDLQNGDSVEWAYKKAIY